MKVADIYKMDAFPKGVKNSQGNDDQAGGVSGKHREFFSKIEL